MLSLIGCCRSVFSLLSRLRELYRHKVVLQGGEKCDEYVYGVAYRLVSAVELAHAA